MVCAAKDAEAQCDGEVKKISADFADYTD